MLLRPNQPSYHLEAHVWMFKWVDALGRSLDDCPETRREEALACAREPPPGNLRVVVEALPAVGRSDNFRAYSALWASSRPFFTCRVVHQCS